MALQDWYNISRDEALELAKQMAIDKKDLEAANPDMATAPGLPSEEERAAKAGIEPKPGDEGPAGDDSADKGPGKEGPDEQNP
jgi:hypothetical protein